MAGYAKALDTHIARRINFIIVCSTSENKKRGCRQPEPDEVNRDDIVQYLFVLARNCDHNRQDSLQCNRQCRHTRARVEPGHALKKDRLWPSQNRLAARSAFLGSENRASKWRCPALSTPLRARRTPDASPMKQASQSPPARLGRAHRDTRS